MNKRRITSTCWALVMALTVAWAQAPNNSGTYYKNADGKTGSALKTALYGIIKNPSVVSYDGLIDAYRKTDTRADGYVRDWYSNTTSFRHDTDKAGNYSKEGDVYNREHSVPQSWFSKASPMKSDIVHVIPTDGYVNNRRSSYPFGEVKKVTYSSNNGYSKLGTNSSGATVFEPNDEVKGDIARIYFYMVTCYEDKISNWASNAKSVFDGNKYPGLTTATLEMMMRWSKQDPVDDVELARNEAVYGVQKNRNPFVDYPGLEDYVWGDKKTVAFSYDNYDGSSTGKQSVTIAFSQTAATATLGETFTAPTLTMSPSGLTVAYSSSNTSVATVNSSTGAVTLKAAGTTTITATFAGNDNYYGNSASYTLTVKTSGGGETPVAGEYAATFNFPKENYGMTALSGNTSDYNPNPTTIISDNVTLTMAGNNSSRYWSTNNTYELRVYKTCTMEIAAPENGKITKIVFAGTTVSGIQYNSKGLTNSTWTGEAESVNFTFTATQKINTITVSYEVEGEEQPTLAGDINKDGQVTIADVTALVNILLGKDDAKPYLYDHEAADVNGDGSTTIADVTALVNLLLGKGELKGN